MGKPSDFRLGTKSGLLFKMTIVNSFNFVSALCLVACAGVSNAQQGATTRTNCLQARACTINGTFRMSSDGHGYVGILELPDGCMNVSIPDSEAKKLLGKEPQVRTASGIILPYAAGDLVFEQRVNGRKIGRGPCGQDFLFVK